MAAASTFAMISGAAVLAVVALAGRHDDAAPRASAALPDAPTVGSERQPAAVSEPEPATAQPQARPLVPIEILHVIDGDTVEVRARIWLDQWIVTRVRLRDIDAPEITSRCPEEAARAEAARRHLAILMGKRPAYLADLGRDKYGGRVLGRIVTADGEDLARRMLADGFARTSGGRRRHSWC